MKPTDYIKGNRRGREAHDIELAAMRDPFLSEALEGLENTEGDHGDAVTALDRRIAARAAEQTGTYATADTAGHGTGHPTENRPEYAPEHRAAEHTAHAAQHPAEHVAAMEKAARRKRNLWRAVPVAAAILIAVTAGVLTLRHNPAPMPPGGTPPLADNRPGAPAADSLREDTLTGKSTTAKTPDGDMQSGKGTKPEKKPEIGKGTDAGEGTGTGAPTAPGTQQTGERQPGKRPVNEGNPEGQHPGKKGSGTGQPHENGSGTQQPTGHPDGQQPGEKASGKPRHGNGQPAPRHPGEVAGEETGLAGLSDATNLDEVVVIAYGISKKDAFVGSAGATPPAGTAVPKSGKAPDSVPTIRVRGTGRSNPGDAAYEYLVDGKPFDDIAWLAADRVASINIDHPRKRIVIQTKGTAALAQAIPAGDDLPFMVAETMPKFQGGGLDAFRRWVQARIRKPQPALANGIQGRVIVSFTIDTLGRLTDIQVLQTPDKSLSDEAVRVLKQSPWWEPGRQGNRKVRVKYTLPVDFRDGNMHPRKPAPKAAGTRLFPEKPVEMNGVDISFEEFEEIANPQLIKTADTTDNIPFTEADVAPRFEGGGLEDFRRWVQAHLRKYQWKPTEQPELYGRVVVSFVIDTTGRPGGIRILKSACREFSEETVRVLELSPRWEPGYRLREGKAVKTPVQFTMPVDFRP